MKKIAVIGVGYVGLVTGTCLADLGNEVIGVDIDKKRIEDLNKGIIPIYEPGLADLVVKNVEQNRLSFTTEIGKAIKESEIIFIAVGTPPLPDGTADLTYVKNVAEDIGKNIDGYKVVVNKSTVPIGTGDMVSRIIKQFYDGDFEVVSNPEFLREGCAVEDFMHPERIVVGGTNNGRAMEIMVQLYESLKAPMVLTDVKTAEMIKYASNALLATEISFINSIANICEKLGADVKLVAEGMRQDKRIGKYAFLEAGVGYGGSCFPKDVKALIQIAQENGIRFSILEAVEATNEAQKQSLLVKIQKLIGEDLHEKKIAVWGLAFKPQTDDIREAPSLVVIKQLLDRGAKITVFDPVARLKDNDENIVFSDDYYEAVKGTDCLVIVTEWSDFKKADLNKIKSLMKSPNVVDGRNVFEKKTMEEAGFNYIGIGR